jgi:hypothetical protein
LKRALEARLRRAEELVPERPSLSAPWCLLTHPECERLLVAIESGTLTEEAFAHWVTTARKRQAAGLTEADVHKRFAAQRESRSALESALSKRHGFTYDDTARFDTLDIAPEEVKMLSHLIKHAQTINELRPVADIIARCGFDSRPCSVESFAKLVLAGELPSPRAASV